MHEIVELFAGRGFTSVKRSENRKPLSVLADLEKEVFVGEMHDLDLSEEYRVNFPVAKALGCVWETGEDRLQIVSSLTPLRNTPMGPC